MWKIKLEDIRRIQLELTSFCNAECPSCERQQTRDSHYLIPELNHNVLDYNNIKKWFDYDFPNLETVHLCGNIDEPILHPELINIVEFFSSKVKSNVLISTNGCARDKKFWKTLSNIKNVIVIWGIDGLQNTYHIYRKNLNWNKIYKNFTYFNKNGGKSIWQFIEFEHNYHQINDAREFSKEHSFKFFNLINSNRENNKIKARASEKKKSKQINCKATYKSEEIQESFYVNCEGFVFPCCWIATSFSINELIKKFGETIFYENNLNFMSLKEIIDGKFFDTINKNFNKISCCNRMCKNNETDVKKFERVSI